MSSPVIINPLDLLGPTIPGLFDLPQLPTKEEYIKPEDTDYCKKAAEDKTPPKTPNEANNACQELAEKVAKIKADVEVTRIVAKTAGDMFRQGNPNIMGAFIDAFHKDPAVSEAKTMIVNSLEKEMNKLSKIDISNKCINISSNLQKNEITMTPECQKIKYQSLGLCTLGRKEDIVACMATINDSYKLTNIKMSNKAEATKDCRLTAFIQEVSNLTTDTNIQALLKVMGESSGSNATTNSTADSCSILKETTNEEQYKNAQSCCINKSAGNQLNTISCVGVTNADLSNSMANTDSCMINLGLGTISSVTSTTGLVATGESTSLAVNPGMMDTLMKGAIAITIISAVGGIAYAAINMYGKKNNNQSSEGELSNNNELPEGEYNDEFQDTDLSNDNELLERW